MALTEENGMGTTMLVQPSGYNNGGFGGFGGDGWWIILLFILLGNGNWGNGGYGGNGLYPWMNQADITTSGFQNAATNQAISSLQNSVTSGFGDVQTALCGGFAGVNASIANANMANLERSFGVQTAITNGINNLASQFAQCCCENRAATADVKYTIATEACATRAANTANTQAILDKLCALELDGYKRENDQLRSQLTFANMQASQTAQTARILANNEAQTTALEQYLAPVPRPAYIVQNPSCCANNGFGCGCGA